MSIYKRFSRGVLTGLCRNRRGFSLVELLVVISIVAVLLAMLIPAISKSRTTARFVLCQSNMRQIGVVYISYETDYRYFPLPGNIPERVSSNAASIDPYITGTKFWYCPDRESFSTAPGNNYKYESNNWPLTGYFNFAGTYFNRGMRTRYPQYPGTTPATWYLAYYPFAQDIMRGFINAVDRPTGRYANEPLNRVAHSEGGVLQRSNAVRHDGSVSSQRYFFARDASTHNYYGFNHPGSINTGSSILYHVVDPMPFAPRSGPVTYEP